MDNGTYNQGLRTKSGSISSEQLRQYDMLNSEGGDGFYLKK